MPCTDHAIMKRVTISDLQKHAGRVINELDDGPIVVSRHGRPAAVILGAEAFGEIEQAV